MNNIFKIIFIFSISIWMGGMIFFTFIIAPVLFSSVPIETAGQVVGFIFPYYYKMAYLCGVSAIIAVIFMLGKSVEKTKSLKSIPVILTMMLCLSIYGGEFVQPEMHVLKAIIYDKSKIIDETNKAGIRFNTLHNLSTTINSGVMILGIIVLGIAGTRLKD